ncbi:uncharacterized protein LOC128244677 [Mya arenaria]|uniref:uncharacterized protein LOC128244677 n=1 Tax=Mya arenaria TaxID=6604 RepID=UPI0022E7A8AB|nr:uncharacterized protein LOC128244677 [Mya arenaria]
MAAKYLVVNLRHRFCCTFESKTCLSQVFKQPRRYLLKSSVQKEFRPMHQEDNIPQNYVLAYAASHPRQYTIGVPMIYASFIALTGVSAYLSWKSLRSNESNTRREKVVLSDTYKPIDPLFLAGGVTVLGFVMTVVVFVYTKGVILRMYYSEELKNFIAVFCRHGIFKENVTVKPGDVKLLPNGDMRGPYKVGKTRINLPYNRFTASHYYNVFFGYEK